MNIVIDNSCAENGRGIVLSYAIANHIYFNSFSNNPSGNVYSVDSSANIWDSLNEIYYYYQGTLCQNYLGNYYSDHCLADSNSDGITDSDYNLPGDEPNDLYPLAADADNYFLQAWYLHDNNEMCLNDMSNLPAGVAIADSNSRIWTAGQPAFTTIEFSESDICTGQLFFTSAPTDGDSFTIEMGSSTDGNDFVPSGQDITFIADGNTIGFAYSMDANAFSIDKGDYLALRITNNNVSGYNVLTGGAWSYLSLPYAPIPGDFEPDGDVDFIDYSTLALCWMTDFDDNNWNEKCDISEPNDNKIDYNDLMVFVGNWLKGKD